MFIFGINFFFEECKEGERLHFAAECEWYNLCLNGKYVSYRCPNNGEGQRLMFNPIINNCTDNVKLPVDGKCQSFKECLLIESVSPFGKWTEVACGSGQHFDQKSQKCIEAEASTCSKCFSSFFCQKRFSSLFFKNKYDFVCVRN